MTRPSELNRVSRADRANEFYRNLAGKKFGLWTVICLSKRKPVHGRRFLVCRCICGVKRIVDALQIKNGYTKSCGCIRSKLSEEAVTIHGMSKTPEFNRWQGMLGRCLNIRNKDYARYGGRGISVSKRWYSFTNFFADMGPIPFPSAQVDRKNNDGNYSKRNCRWASYTTNNRNRRGCHKYWYAGKKRPLGDICEMENIGYGAVYLRIKRGWSLHDALTKPISLSGTVRHGTRRQKANSR